MQVPRFMPKGRKGKTTSGSSTRRCAHAGGTVQIRKERKGNRENQRKRTKTKQLLCDDGKMSGCGTSSIPKSSEHAMHHEWLETGWACGHSGQPPFCLIPVLTTAGCKNVRNVNDAPTGELENGSWQEQVKNKKVNNRWKEGGQSKQKSTNRSSSFVNDVYS